MKIHLITAATVVAMLSACSGGSPTEDTASTAQSPNDASALAGDKPAATHDTAGWSNQANANHGENAATTDSRGMHGPSPDATQLVMLDSGLYALDPDKTWRKLENGKWVSVSPPQ